MDLELRHFKPVTLKFKYPNATLKKPQKPQGWSFSIISLILKKVCCNLTKKKIMTNEFAYNTFFNNQNT